MVFTIISCIIAVIVYKIFTTLKTRDLTVKIAPVQTVDSHKKPYEKDTIYYYHFGPHKHIPSASPFCLKLELFMKMAGLKYKTVVDVNKQAPTGKSPFIVHNSKLVDDSGVCIDYLKDEYKLDIDEHLSLQDHCKGKLMLNTLENRTYFTMVYIRWQIPENFVKIKHDFFALAPQGVKQIIPLIVKHNLGEQVYHHGSGRFTLKKQLERYNEDLQCCSELLGKSKYLLGDRISSYDAGFYGFLANFFVEFPSDVLREHVQKYANLVNYVTHMRERYFPDSFDLTGYLK